MEQPALIQSFFQKIQYAIDQDQFIRMTLAKPRQKTAPLQNVYIRLVSIKDLLSLSFTLHYQTNDQVKNHTIKEGIKAIDDLMENEFKEAYLFTSTGDFRLTFNKRNRARFLQGKPSSTIVPSRQHDHLKSRKIEINNNVYLQALGIITTKNQVAKDKGDKLRQIHRYVEIMDHLFSKLSLTAPIHVADMGSGKGYLTFALHDHLKNNLNLSPTTQGIELRPDLVTLCNQIAKRAQFNQLSFHAQRIEEFSSKSLDVLIALHACDTATDEAIAKGIQSKAQLIVVAPCCHKQIRPQIKSDGALAPLLTHGILLERQAEMITDTIRALLLEKHGYTTKVFEWISTEHTGKNVMITAIKNEISKVDKEVLTQITNLKSYFGIKEHHLESLLK